MKRTAIVLPTAFVTTLKERADRDIRISQYVNGFKQISDFVAKHEQFDVFVVDSTIENEQNIDRRLIDAIHSIKNLRGTYFFDNNKYGKINKGAGLIVQWKYALEKIPKDYEYIIHFEPRQRLIDFSFFDRFVANKQNYVRTWFPKVKRFKIFPITLSQIFTGMIALKRVVLEKYCANVDLEKMTRDRVSIEDDMYTFLQKNNIPFQHVDKLGISWHDVANKTYVNI